MNRSSITFSITITFVALFIFILMSFTVLYKESQHREESFSKHRAMDVSRIILKELQRDGALTIDTKEYLASIDLMLVEDKESILENPHRHLNWRERRRNLSISNFELNHKNFVWIKTRRENILLLDVNETDSFRSVVFLILLLLLIAFGFLYYNILKKLRPLGILKEKVKNFGAEEFDIACRSDAKDEISLLANEFDKSAKQLKKIKESRNMFIRNIMHELKTPIAKGHILVQLSPTQESREKLQKVFYRLESLINEFASIEELISTKKEISKKEYFFSDIIENAADLLMSSQMSVVEEFEDMKVKVDFKLFSIAVKNLMDNAIKYSNDKRVTIKSDAKTLIFENRGEMLIYPLHEYFEPFFREEGRVSNQSFGLGLYIVKNILDAHGAKLEYKHKDGVNTFSIILFD